ncbi:MAG: phosphoglucosamine mutase, partial [Clostridia bacterium]|nr:phosphoglucosamine mutase [Clostridia bacterium]
MARLFGTDGVRGEANRELTPELALGLGRALVQVLGSGHGRPRILIGRDTRRSGDMLAAALSAGLASAGADVVSAGVVTTPAVARLVSSEGFDAGGVVSASHNPAAYNGIKFFSADGLKLADDLEEAVERLLGEPLTPSARPGGEAVGAIREDAGLAERYLEWVVATVGPALKGLRVVCDCANGAAYRLAPEALRRAGAEVVALHAEPDGLNVNRDCGSLHPASLQRAVLEHRADAGLALDGDADRCIAVDEQGQVVDGDQILAIAATHLLARGALPHNTVVATVMSNLGLERYLAAAGIRVVRTPVGDRHVQEAMRRGGFALGGEQSGHIIFGAHATTGDGILTGLQLLRITVAEGQPLSRLAARMRRYPQVLVNVPMPRGVCWEEAPAVQAALAEARRRLEGEGRVLV